MNYRFASIEVVTLFVEDFGDAKAFYIRIFSPDVVYEDDVSVVFKFGGVMVNLLQATEAPPLIAPIAVTAPAAGARVLFTIRVEDVDGVCAELARQGVALLNGPLDRPWGRRTAAFADPAGHVWEIAQELAAS